MTIAYTHILSIDPITYRRKQSNSTPSLVYRAKMPGRSCDYGAYWSDHPLTLTHLWTMFLIGAPHTPLHTPDPKYTPPKPPSTCCCAPTTTHPYEQYGATFPPRSHSVYDFLSSNRNLCWTMGEICAYFGSYVSCLSTSVQSPQGRGWHPSFYHFFVGLHGKKSHLQFNCPCD